MPMIMWHSWISGRALFSSIRPPELPCRLTALTGDWQQPAKSGRSCPKNRCRKAAVHGLR
jgi:hypothetical protein